MADMEYKNGALHINKLNIDGNEYATIDDPESRSEMLIDASSRIISYRESDGSLVENAGIKTSRLVLTSEGMTEFQQALKDSGFEPGGKGDWSEASSLEIPEPRLIFMNFTNDAGNLTWPTSKTQDLHAYMEFFDKGGNYFKKRVIFNAQGNSSMAFQKKNGAVDICNDEWVGDDTFKLKIGSWVEQDSFHFKSAATDFFKGISFIAYKIALQVNNTRPINENRTWKLGLLNGREIGSDQFTSNQIDDLSVNLDNGALCQPDGIPAITYLNGEFYGIYTFALKKHRDNYHMKKNNPKNIHVDCGDGGNPFNLGWGGFEVRSPKDLVYSTAHNGTYKYDADDPGQFEIAGNTDGTTNFDSWDSSTEYAVDKIVEHNGHYFINTVENNSSEPIYDKKNNGDDKPDYKNKTGCGWINCTNSAKTKANIITIRKKLFSVRDMLTISTSNGNIQLGDYMGDTYYADVNYGKGNWIEISDASSLTRYMSIHSNNTGNPVTDTNNWMDITQNIDDARTEYEKYFDVQNIIDYELVQCAVSDPDSITKNCQWTTWDGKRWYINNYDKDMSLGGDFVGWITEPVRKSGGWARDVRTESSSASTSISYPIGVAIKLYSNRFKTRWFELVEKGIFTTENFMKLINDWMQRIGQSYYDKEYNEKWPTSSCFRDNGVDHEYWDFTSHSYYNLPEGILVWDSSTEYAVGDQAGIQFSNAYGYAIMTCLKSCINVNPIVKSYGSQPPLFGYYDSVWRVQKFIERNFELENEFFNTLK